MDYKEKYEQALERAKDMLANKEVRQEDMEYLFPELQEDKDERIRKTIIRFFKDNYPNETEMYDGSVTVGKALAWLEKQGKEGYALKSFKDKDVHKFVQYIEKQAKAYEFNLPNRGYDIYAFAKDILYWLEKQGKYSWKPTEEQLEALDYAYNNCPDTERGNYYESVLADLITDLHKLHEKQNNSTLCQSEVTKASKQKLEPKFKVGDWVLNNVCFPMQIASIRDGMYIFTKGDAMSVLFIDGNYHLWTIQDAMDGDVLINWNNTTFIFKAIEDGAVKFHIAYNERLNTIATPLTKLSHQGLAKPEFEFRPASKEQCDTLFAKMKKAGYEWDADKKELKKIEQKPADKTEPKFHEDDWIVFNGSILHIDEVVNGYYRTTSRGDGIHNSYDWDIDNAARLWTIQEAKDGDVLAYVTDEEDLWIMIYRSLYEPYEGHVHYYALLVNDNFSDNFSDRGTCCICIDNLKPATKEQRKLLFQKMKEAGYEWDADKKGVKTIESKTLDVWNAEDEQNLNVVLSFIPDECLRRWLKDKLCYDTLDANKVIEWLTTNVRLYASLNFLYGSDCPQGDVEVESLVKSFKKDFGL